MTASPSRSAVKASPCGGAAGPSRGPRRAFAPAMNRRAMWVAAEPREPGQHPRAGACRRAPAQTASRSHQGTRSPASPRYSARCRRTARVVSQRGHRVDEPEELDLDHRVAQGQVHELVVPPGSLSRPRAPADRFRTGRARSPGSDASREPASRTRSAVRDAIDAFSGGIEAELRPPYLTMSTPRATPRDRPRCRRAMDVVETEKPRRASDLAP